MGEAMGAVAYEMGTRLGHRLDPSVSEVRRWLEAGRDVVVTGDSGSGRTSLLARAADRLRRLGWDIVRVSGTVSAVGGRFSAVARHPAIIRTPGVLPGPSDLEAALVDELDGPLPLILVDDLELLDDGSLEVVDGLLRRTGARLLVSVGADFNRRTELTAHGVLRGRRLQQVALAPLGLGELSRLLSVELGAPSSVPLLSAVVARSSGNVSATLAVMDAARWSGAIAEVEGMWELTGDLDAAPLDAVAETFTQRLEPAQVDALETLAWARGLPLDDAASLVGASQLGALSDLQRVVTHASPGVDLVLVSPPVLAESLRQRLSSVRRRLLTERVGLSLSASVPVESVPVAVDSPGWLARSNVVASDDRGDGAGHAPQPAELASLILERTRTEESRAVDVWCAEPTVANATALVEASLGVPSRVDLERVFANTEVGDGDDPDAVTRLSAFRAQWSLFSPPPPPDGRADAPHPVAGSTLRRLLTSLAASGSDTARVHGWRAAIDAMTRLESGDASAALELVDSIETCGDRLLQGLVGSLRSDALLFRGDLAELERSARAELESARIRLDPNGIRVHSLGLAESLCATGRWDEAWKAIEAALTLGPPGALDLGSYPRLLALGVAVLSRADDTELAESLCRELDRSTGVLPSPFGSLNGWAAAQLLYARSECELADDLLWRHGLAAFEEGRLASAALHWAARTGPYSADQTAVVERLLQRLEPGAFTPLLRLRLALSSEDVSSVSDAAADLPASTLEAVLPDVAARLGAGLEAADLGDSLLGRLLHNAPAVVAAHSARVTRIPLSDREREVALLARSGLSNRDIARRLFLSIRTVENHMYRVLRKLGLARRSDLESRWDPEAA